MEIVRLSDKYLIKAGNVVKRSMAPSLVHLNEEVRKGILARYNPKNFKQKVCKGDYFVAIKGGKLVGVIGLIENEVRTFYVDPKQQGRGIGAKLFKRLIRELKSKGIKNIYVNTSSSAKSYYLKLGFEVVEEKYYKEDNFWQYTLKRQV